MSMNFKSCLIGGVVILFADQVTKILATHAGMVVINQGISFNIGEKISPYLLDFALLAFLFFIGAIAREFWSRHPFLTGSFFGAALSNIGDRIFFGGVRDWLNLPFVHLKNNVADISIFVIILLILIEEWRYNQQISTVSDGE